MTVAVGRREPPKGLLERRRPPRTGCRASPQEHGGVVLGEVRPSVLVRRNSRGNLRAHLYHRCRVSGRADRGTAQAKAAAASRRCSTGVRRPPRLPPLPSQSTTRPRLEHGACEPDARREPVGTRPLQLRASGPLLLARVPPPKIVVTDSTAPGAREQVLGEAGASALRRISALLVGTTGRSTPLAHESEDALGTITASSRPRACRGTRATDCETRLSRSRHEKSCCRNERWLATLPC